MREVDLTKQVYKFIKTLPPKQGGQIARLILRLQENPQDAKMLRGYQEYYRVDSGEYRIIYSFDVDTIYVLLIGKRNDSDVYKKLKRKT